MLEEQAFRELLRQARAGDEDAAARLVREYEPQIRRRIRVHLAPSPLGRLLEPVDICQSVLVAFFHRLAGGGFHLLQTPRQLVHLLLTMARNKLTDHARRQHARRRDQRRLDPAAAADLDRLPDDSPSPPEVVAGEDFLQEVYRRLSPEERRLADLRAAGRNWAALAAELGGTPEGLRKRLHRAIARVRSELDQDEANHEHARR
jgi:RNA polymerase sigma factor (sigma-70 family)